MSDLLKEKQPVLFDARNLIPKYRKARIGDVYSINCEVDEATWNQLKTIPAGVELTITLWWHNGDGDSGTVEVEKPKREKKPKPEKGTHGKYWQAMFRHGALNHPDLPQAVRIDEGNFSEGEQGIKEALRATFEVSSLTFISPDDFDRWCDDRNMHSLITLSRQAAAEAQG